VSHDVKIQGQLLKAGAYGLHFIPGESEWTIIFSNNHTSWGSFTYDPKEDALRVTAKPSTSEYHEWLTYDFVDRKPEQATVALRWENLELPFTITVDHMKGLYVQKIAEELRDSDGFSWVNWNAAALYCLTSNTHLDQGLEWAQNAVSLPFVGEENFSTLTTLSQLQAANGMADEAKKTFDQAMNHSSAKPTIVHQYARQLLSTKTDEAVRIFELNAKKFPNQWPTTVGLARAYSAKGNYEEALKYARIAVKEAPDNANRRNLETMIQTLEQGRDIN
jgi:tetratricopeptide (TPR) repeat protein